jgi:ELWxxDGT repeat protein
VVGSYIYFNYTGLWRSDGTTAGTNQIWTNEPGGFSDPQVFTGFGNKVLFYANDQSDGASNPYNYELYKLAPCTACPVSRQGVSPELATNLTVTVLKNPTPDAVTVEIRGADGQPLSLQLTNLLGQPIGSKNIETAQTLERHRFDVRTLPSGILLLRAVSGDYSQTVRISKTD